MGQEREKRGEKGAEPQREVWGAQQEQKKGQLRAMMGTQRQSAGEKKDLSFENAFLVVTGIMLHWSRSDGTMCMIDLQGVLYLIIA